MDRNTKLELLEIQLRNVVNLLDADVIRQQVVTSSGKQQRRIIITYDHDEVFDEAFR